MVNVYLVVIVVISLFAIQSNGSAIGCEPAYMDDDRPQYQVPSEFETRLPPLPLPRPKNLQNSN